MIYRDFGEMLDFTELSENWAPNWYSLGELFLLFFGGSVRFYLQYIYILTGWTPEFTWVMRTWVSTFCTFERIVASIVPKLWGVWLQVFKSCTYFRIGFIWWVGIYPKYFEVLVKRELEFLNVNVWLLMEIYHDFMMNIQWFSSHWFVCSKHFLLWLVS